MIASRFLLAAEVQREIAKSLATYRTLSIVNHLHFNAIVKMRRKQGQISQFGAVAQFLARRRTVPITALLAIE